MVVQDSVTEAVLLSLCASIASASTHHGGSYYGSSNPFRDTGGSFGNSTELRAILEGKHGMVIAHGVLASAAFVLLFPVGGIIMSFPTSKFPNRWRLHASLQCLAYLLFVAAAGIGIYIATSIGALTQTHPIIGMILLGALFFQLILGAVRHFVFKERVLWKWTHVYAGRIFITLGIINGGLGLQLAMRTGVFAPSKGARIAYGVVAAVFWLLFVASINASTVGPRSKKNEASQADRTAGPEVEIVMHNAK